MANFAFKSFRFLMQKRASSSVPSSSPFTVKYLVDSCGFELQSAIATSRKLNRKLDESNIHRSDSVLNLFKSYGFEKTHIAEIIRKLPNLLHFVPDRRLRPKMEYLVEIGFSDSALHDLIARNPNIFGSGLDSMIKPGFEYLRESLGTHERARAVVMNCPWFLTKNVWKPNIDLLLREGVAVDTIVKNIRHNAVSIMQNVDEMHRAVDAVKKLGINPAKPKFFNAVMVVVNFPVWEKKAGVFKSFGLSKEDVLSSLKLHPHCFDYSEKRLRSSFEFLVNTVKLDPKTVSSHPTILAYAIDKRVRPRYNVLRLLFSEKLVREGDAEFVRSLFMTEEVFLEEYVYKHSHRIPCLMDVYRSEIATKETA